MDDCVLIFDNNYDLKSDYFDFKNCFIRLLNDESKEDYFSFVIEKLTKNSSLEIDFRYYFDEKSLYKIMDLSIFKNIEFKTCYADFELGTARDLNIVKTPILGKYILIEDEDPDFINLSIAEHYDDVYVKKIEVSSINTYGRGAYFPTDYVDSQFFENFSDSELENFVKYNFFKINKFINNLKYRYKKTNIPDTKFWNIYKDLSIFI